MAATLATGVGLPARRIRHEARGFWLEAWSRLRLNRAAMAGLFAILVLIALAILAPLLTPYDYADGDLLTGTQGPSRDHLLGTDELGRDIFTRLLYGARVSLTVAIAAQIVIVVVGVPVGLLTGYVGGWLDMGVMRVIDAIYALPNLLIAILIVSMLRSNISATAKSSGNWLTSLDRVTDGLIGIFIVMSLTHWLTVSRLVRAQVLAIKEREHVEAARTLGATGPRIVRVHIMPHVLAPVIIAIAFGVPGAIMLEASLSFLGIGVNPPTPSWGLMISGGITNMRSHPHMLISPALALGVTLLAFTFLGDGLRDAMDPHMKR
ncbi:MAG: oligopeptide transport system permease protein [Thermomicrobiales bacterium]|jgi:ABC-type dipeptide/oligopeptide/nickel transport system permease subunit|nr:oligopeptide transport system permease protein [Thermomicrobiales bacterium]